MSCRKASIASDTTAAAAASLQPGPKQIAYVRAARWRRRCRQKQLDMPEARIDELGVPSQRLPALRRLHDHHRQSSSAAASRSSGRGPPSAAIRVQTRTTPSCRSIQLTIPGKSPGSQRAAPKFASHTSFAWLQDQSWPEFIRRSSSFNPTCSDPPGENRSAKPNPVQPDHRKTCG